MIEPRATAPARRTPAVGPPSILLLDGVPQSARHAREFVREFIAYHVPGASEDHVENAILAASEMVTNAIRYGTEPGDSLRVEIHADDVRTRIEVHDPVRRRPRSRPKSDERDRGRGLIILDALCGPHGTGWGVKDIPLGKAVWAEVKAS
ncbi:ATP-binding protein [Streptomyces sp. NPDC002845]